MFKIKKESKKTINVRLDVELLNEIERIADLNNCTLSDVVRFLINVAIDADKRLANKKAKK